VSQENDISASLSAMTCLHGGPELYEAKSAQLGPDPLRDDADRERLWDKMQSTRKAVGQVG
jgi:endonuclease VIII